MEQGIHLNLDDAWSGVETRLRVLDVRDWGPRLRFSAPPAEIERFAAETLSKLPPFILYGSGDFHHLTALWLRRMAEPFTLISIDNHPDWDVRPPRWCCGGWINRALDLPNLKRAAVWGCGNFECRWPMRFFGNRKALKSGRLAVHPWMDERPAGVRNDPDGITRSDWRAKFTAFAESLRGQRVYVTIDMDCLAPGVSATNWENGRFELNDVIWIVRELRGGSEVVGADLCGAYSEPVYARMKQRFAARMDHPKVDLAYIEERLARNAEVFRAIWPELAVYGPPENLRGGEIIVPQETPS